ncbi:MAG: hypothetical protein ACFFCW_25985 [Candidatus Hodarchaeota archaeon]
MQIEQNETFNQVLNEYFRVAGTYNRNKKWNEMTENELWYELCICILSSNVPYELAKSAFLHLLQKGFLQLDWIVNEDSSQKIMTEELSKPLYLPKKLDGSCRKYRFPNMRSKNITQAARLIASNNDLIKKILTGSSSEGEVRDYLVANIPGIGLKQSSHFLRNIGYSDELAIIDSHVITFLERIGMLEQRKAKHITDSTYLDLENKLKKLSRKFELNLSIFDMAIWNHMRKK